MGLGWHFNTTKETRWHNGQTGGYHSIGAVDRKAKTALIVLANSATPLVDQFAASVALMLRERK